VKIPALIVTYYPSNKTILNVCELSKNNLVPVILIVDNTGEDNEVLDELAKIRKVKIIKNEKNMGIAYAQNVGIKYLINESYSFVITYDQDSVIVDNPIQLFSDYIDSNDMGRIGIITSNYIDKRINKVEYDIKTPILTDVVISSGSVINIKSFVDVGGMKEYYFMDQVDNEYCYRLVNKNYDILVLPFIGMCHELGNIKMINILGFKFYTYNQNPMRTYYRTRNSIYFKSEYKDNLLKKKISRQLRIDFIKLFFEKSTFKKIKMFLKGKKDGKKWKKINKNNLILFN